MARRTKTFSFPLSPKVKSVRPDVIIPLKTATGGGHLGISATCSRYPLGPETVATESQDLSAGAAVRKLDLLSNVRQKVGTEKYAVKVIKMEKTESVGVKLPDVSGRVHSIECRPPERVETSRNEPSGY